MGDSDEEYDRRRGRDKFRRERSDYTERRRDRDDRSSRREDWSDRRRGDNSWDSRRRDYRDVERGRRDSSGRHHEMSPPMKRVRRDWDEPHYGDQPFAPYGGGGMAHHGGAWGHPNVDMQQMQPPQDARQQRGEMDMQASGPMMMTFKQFLNAQEDNIDDMEAVKKYQEYKLEFKKTQMADFFTQHKEEEWFKMKYHPHDASIRQKEALKSVKKRLAVFLNLMAAGRMENLTLDIENTDAIIKVLDAVVIKLEGGNDSDLAILDRPATPIPERRRTSSNPLASPRDEERDGERGHSRDRGDGTPKSSEDKKEQDGGRSTSSSPRGKSKAKTVAIPEAGPVSPSSVPLPDTPAPPSKKSDTSKKRKDSSEVKPIAMPEPTAEQKQLQQQAQYYHQQQLYYQQQQEYYARLQEHQQKYGTGANAEPFPYPPPQPVAPPPTGSDKKEDSKKKRKRRHREPYYYDEMDDSESESESDSEPEPAPPGEEASPMETGADDELMPPGVEAPSQDDNLRPPGVEESSTVEASLQVPTSSSAAKLSSEASDNKPDEDEQAVGSSEPESGSADGAMQASSTEGKVINGGTEEPVAASSTEETREKSRPETSVSERSVLTSSSDQLGTLVTDGAAADSTQSPDSKSQSPGDSSTAVSGSDKVTKPAEQVGSSDNGVSTVKSSDDTEMVPASTSDAAEVQSKSLKPEVATAQPGIEQPHPSPSSDQGRKEEPKSEQVDSNKLAEKKEVKEEESPMKSAPEKKSDARENAVEEKEKDTTEAAAMEEGEEPEGSVKELVIPGVSEPRPLHKTYSLFIRNVPPSVSKADVATVCKRFAGFLRIALSDPSPERKFYRRGWITFDRSVTIKEICWDLNNIRVKDSELNPVINRDLSRRVRPVAGFTVAKQIVRDDIKLAARIIRELDKKSRLYEIEKIEEVKEKEVVEKKEEGEEGEEKQLETEAEEIPVDLPKENPILVSLCDDATEEEEGEEMELLGTASPTRDGGGEKSEVDLSRDETLLKVLDRLILYLRIVHSLDYYNGSDYPYEDEMPNRCGIIHVRGPMPEKATQAEVSDGQKNLKGKLEPFLQPKVLLTDEEVAKFGKKDPEAEIEKFVQANTQELAKDKWLCPLSGKKFRGPEFVRKHIFNKHIDKVEAVRMEAEFFNSYIADPGRPHNPEPERQKTSSAQGGAVGQMYGAQQHSQAMMGGWGRGHHAMMYGGPGPRGPYTPQYGGHGYGHGHEMYGGRGGGHTYPPKPRRFGYGGGRNRGNQSGGFHRDPRQIVQYRDLDAPEDNDF